MKMRNLGNTDITISELGFGCASVWGKNFFVEQEAMDLFQTAVEEGITFFDTGYSYGHAEERLGKCLQQLGTQKRKELTIATKCGTRISDTPTVCVS